MGTRLIMIFMTQKLRNIVICHCLLTAVDDDHDKDNSSRPLVLIIGALGGLLAVAIILTVALTFMSKKKKRGESLSVKSKGHKCPYDRKCDLPDCAAQTNFALEQVMQDGTGP